MCPLFFWFFGLLVLTITNYAECSMEDNEIPPLNANMNKKLLFSKSVENIENIKTYILDDELPLNDTQVSFKVNFIVDAIIIATRQAIIAEGASQINLDPVDTDIQISLGFATVPAHVKLTNGTLRALDSIERRGDAKIIPRIINPGLDVVATLGLQTAKAEYYYYLQILATHPNGNLTAVIKENAVEVKFSLNLDKQGCHLKLIELKMTTCSDVEVTLTGLYPFDTWSSRLATELIQPLDGQLANKIEDTLRYYIDQEIHKIPCAKK